jgi:hypothetical protein
VRCFRTQQRKRQTWLALPASGIEEVVHGQNWKRAISEGRREADRVRREGTAASVPAWNAAEAGRAYDLERGHRTSFSDCAREALKARHEIVISENVAREFRNQSMVELKRDPGDEIIAPTQTLTYS